MAVEMEELAADWIWWSSSSPSSSSSLGGGGGDWIVGRHLKLKKFFQKMFDIIILQRERAANCEILGWKKVERYLVMRVKEKV